MVASRLGNLLNVVYIETIVCAVQKFTQKCFSTGVSSFRCSSLAYKQLTVMNYFCSLTEEKLSCSSLFECLCTF